MIDSRGKKFLKHSDTLLTIVSNSESLNSDICRRFLGHLIDVVFETSEC